jgi:DNA repair protein RadC
MKQELIATRIREVEVKYKTLQKLPDPVKIRSSQELYMMYRFLLMSERVEVFCVALLDQKNQIMAIDYVSRGSLASSIVHPREVFTNPVRLQAASIILMHNHPSGDPTPSREDKECTARLVQAAKILGIRILDHIIFGEVDYFSFADSELMDETN